MNKEILVPTDKEFADMKADPNYVGDGKLRYREVKTSFKFLDMVCVYHGDATNVLAPTNHNRHAIKIINTNTKMNVTVPYWSPEVQGAITSKKDMLIALHRILGCSVMGRLTPDEFCTAMGIDDSTKRAEVTFRQYELIRERLEKILPDPTVDFLLRELIKAGVR